MNAKIVMVTAVVILLQVSVSLDVNSSSQLYAGSAPSWINGIWAGKGEQFDTGQKWQIVIKASTRQGIYRVSYPTLNCGGDMTFLGTQGGKAYFRETLTYGLENCVDGGKIELTRQGSGLKYRYWNPGHDTVNAVGLLLPSGK